MFYGSSRAPTPTDDKVKTTIQSENRNQAFSSGRIVSQATVEFAVQTSSGSTDEVLISLCYELLIHRKRSVNCQVKCNTF